MEKAPTNIAQALGISSNGIQASFIPPELLASMANDVLPLLDQGLAHAEGEVSPEIMLNLIYLGYMHLACLFRDGELRLACVVQFQDRPAYRVAQIVALAGSDFLFARRYFRWFCFWAASHECVAIEAWTRPKLTRALARYGFAKVHDVVRFTLKGFLQ